VTAAVVVLLSALPCIKVSCVLRRVIGTKPHGVEAAVAKWSEHSVGSVFLEEATTNDVVELGMPTLHVQSSVMRRNMTWRMHVAGGMLPFRRLHIPPLTSTPACGWRLRRTRESWATWPRWQRMLSAAQAPALAAVLFHTLMAAVAALMKHTVHSNASSFACCRRVAPGTQATAAFVAKADGVLAGLAVADEVTPPWSGTAYSPLLLLYGQLATHGALESTCTARTCSCTRLLTLH
jgi:hypothetical protein